jgi:hypothetical protein
VGGGGVGFSSSLLTIPTHPPSFKTLWSNEPCAVEAGNMTVRKLNTYRNSNEIETKKQAEMKTIVPTIKTNKIENNKR